MKASHARYLLVLILLFSYTCRVWRLAIPSEYYFDEVYHAFTAEAYARNDPKGYEWWHQAPEGVAYEWLHPPVAKLIQASSIFVLGENSFSWRFPSVIFGVLTVWAIYMLALKTTKQPQVAILAAMIASFEGLLLTQSRIAMNDIFVTFFVLVAVTTYYLSTVKVDWWKFTLITGLFTGLAVSTKWSGVYLILIYAIFEVWHSKLRFKGKTVSWVSRWLAATLFFSIGLLIYKTWPDLVNVSWLSILILIIFGCLATALAVGFRRFVISFVCLILVPITIYILSFSQFWLQGHTLEQFYELHKQIWWYQTNLDATHTYQSVPFEWILNLRPVWYWVDYGDNTIANIYALANPIIAWIGLVSIVWNLIAAVIRKIPERMLIICAYLAVWLPWAVSPRIMFFYHYTPGIAFLCVSLGMMIADWWKINTYTKFLAKLALVAMGVCFIYFFPHWTGIKVSSEYANYFYWFKTWK